MNGSANFQFYISKTPVIKLNIKSSQQKKYKAIVRKAKKIRILYKNIEARNFLIKNIKSKQGSATTVSKATFTRMNQV